jgi:hypothetical protein
MFVRLLKVDIANRRLWAFLAKLLMSATSLVCPPHQAQTIQFHPHDGAKEISAAPAFLGLTAVTGLCSDPT